jgi:hypothetical protein
MVGFGRNFQGMTDREILIELAGKVEQLTEAVENRPPCPSPLCSEHTRALIEMQTTIKVVAAVAVFIVPTLLVIIELLL